RRDLNEALGRHFSSRERVDSDSVAGIAGLCAGRIGDRSQGSVKMLAVAAEGETDVVALVSILAEAVIGKVSELVAGEIEYGDGLVDLALLGSVPVMQHGGVASVGTEREADREAVDAVNAAGNGPQAFARGQAAASFLGDSDQGGQGGQAGRNQQECEALQRD